MVVHAIKKNGGLFIPNVTEDILNSKKVILEIEIKQKEPHKDKEDLNIIYKTAGIWKGRSEDGVELQRKLRREWEHRP